MANSEDQMSNLFEEGGIADDGMNVDPVSGNEIPPGSMAQEVRDDVPAQLSEGEYVVPADVLRFYGVKFFEDLRAEAKQGMMQMEADGRIGGEPVPTGGPEQEMSDLTPEEMAVLQEMGLAVGGMVPQPTQSTNPSMQQQQMYQQPSPVAMGNTGYAEGGGVQGYNKAGVVSTAPDLLSQYGMGFSFNQDPVTTQSTSTVILYSPDGLTTQSFSLPAQQTEYDAKVAEGWTTTQVAVTTETSVNDEDPNDYGNDTGEDGKKFSEMNPEELQKAYADNKKARTIMKGLAVINPVFGLLGMGATKHAEKQIQEAMDALKIKPLEDKDGEGILSGLGDSIKNLFGGDKKEETKETPVITPIPKQAVVTDEPVYGTTSDSQIKERQDNRSDRSSEISVGQSNISKGMSGKSTDYKTAATKAATKSLSSEEKKGGAALDESFGISGLNSGGLMRNKKKKKK